VEQGLTYPEILNIARRGVNLGEYLRFRRCGVTPEQAEELLRAGVKPEDYVEGVKQGLAYPEILNIARRGGFQRVPVSQEVWDYPAWEYLCSARSTTNSDRGSPVGKLSLDNREE
jgi:tRNA(His) 5'-end guanylyltransferase